MKVAELNIHIKIIIVISKSGIRLFLVMPLPSFQLSASSTPPVYKEREWKKLGGRKVIQFSCVLKSRPHQIITG